MLKLFTSCNTRKRLWVKHQGQNDKMPTMRRHGRTGVCFGSYSDIWLKACEPHCCSAFTTASSTSIHGIKKRSEMYDHPLCFTLPPLIKCNNKWCHAIWAKWNELITRSAPADYCTLNATSRPMVWKEYVCGVKCGLSMGNTQTHTHTTT